MKAHNFDADEAPSLRCLVLLRMHLLKARSGEDGVEFEAAQLAKEQREAYKAKQAALVGLGVASVALLCVATHAANVEGNLADEGLELLLEMLNDGNQAVQVRVKSQGKGAHSSFKIKKISQTRGSPGPV